MNYKELDVILKQYDDNDCLEFSIDEEIVYINLNSDNQTNLRNLFYKLISKLINEPIQFKLKIEDEEKYNENDLFREISEEYLKKLNEEMITIYGNIPDELKTKNTEFSKN